MLKGRRDLKQAKKQINLNHLLNVVAVFCFNLENMQNSIKNII